jgi:hypothetical protein
MVWLCLLLLFLCCGGWLLGFRIAARCTVNCVTTHYIPAPIIYVFLLLARVSFFVCACICTPAEAAADAAAVDRPPSSASGVSNGGGAIGGAGAGAAGSGGVGGACVPAFKSACITALREYFDSSDVREVAAR